MNNYQTEVQNVVNNTSFDPNDPIFSAYDANSVPVPLPVNMDSATVANINTIRVKLTVRSPYPDPKTGQYPETTMLSTVRIHNCSAAFAIGQNTVLGCG